MHVCTVVFDRFHNLCYDVLLAIIRKLNKTTCVLILFNNIFYVSVIFYYRYYSTYCESLFIDVLILLVLCKYIYCKMLSNVILTSFIAFVLLFLLIRNCT